MCIRDRYGKKVYVCDGTACLTSGSQADLKRKLLEQYSEHEIGSMTCLGHCHSNNAFMVNGEIRVEGAAQNTKTLRISSNTDKPALLTPEGDIDVYYALAGDYMTDAGSALKELELSGLRGRGGAGSVSYTHLRAHETDSYLVC